MAENMGAVAAEAASAAGRGLDGLMESAAAAVNLRAAAARRRAAAASEQLAQQQEHEEKVRQERIKLINEGWVQQNASSLDGRPTIMKNGPGGDTDLHDRSKTVTGLDGSTWYKPTAEEKTPPLDNTNSIPVGEGLAADLEKAGVHGYSPGERVPHALLGALDAEADRKPKQQEADSKEQQSVLDKGGLPVSDSGTVAQNLDVPRSRMDASGNVTGVGMGTNEAPDERTGSVVDAGGKKYYLASKQPKRPVEKPEKFAYNHWTDDSGRVSVTRIGADETPEKWNGKAWVPLAAGEQLGPKRRDPDAAGGRATQLAADRSETRRQAAEDAAQKQIDSYQKQEQEQHGLRSAYGNALNAKDGDKVVDPRTGQTVAMNAARRTYYRQKYDAATEQVGRLQDTQRKLIARRGGSPEGGGAPAAAPAAARVSTGGRGAPAGEPNGTGSRTPRAGKIVPLQRLRDYASANKMTEAEAVKQARAEGYTIGQ